MRTVELRCSPARAIVPGRSDLLPRQVDVKRRNKERLGVW